MQTHPPGPAQAARADRDSETDSTRPATAATGPDAAAGTAGTDPGAVAITDSAASLRPPADIDARLDAIAARIRSAHRVRGRLAIRGGGSKAFLPRDEARATTSISTPGAASEAASDGAAPEPLDLRTLSGLIAYEPSELYVTALAGTPLAALEAELARHGQCLPFEPPHFVHAAGAGPATVGGMVASGFSGPARASAGALRDHVLGVTLIDGRGERLVFGGQVMKNVAGYDVSRLVCGSFGALGVIASVSLKVLPVAPAEATLKFQMTQAGALKNLNAWGGRPLPLNASCWVNDGGVPTLYLRLRGAVAAVESACRALGGERQGGSAREDWRACRDQRLPWFAGRDAAQDLWRVSVPQTATALAGFEGCDAPLIEWHGGLRWFKAPSAAAGAIVDAAIAIGGSATIFIASEVHSTWANGRFGLKNAISTRIGEALEREFDPHGVFDAPPLLAAG